MEDQNQITQGDDPQIVVATNELFSSFKTANYCDSFREDQAQTKFTKKEAVVVQTQHIGKLFKTTKDLKKNQFSKIVLHMDKTISLYKKVSSSKPTKIYDVSKGYLVKDKSQFIMSNDCIPGFLFQMYKDNGKKKTKTPWIIVPETEEDYDSLEQAFLKACGGKIIGDISNEPDCEDTFDQTLTTDQNQSQLLKQQTSQVDNQLQLEESFQVTDLNNQDLKQLLDEQKDIINLLEETKDGQDDDPVKQRMLSLIKQQQNMIINMQSSKSNQGSLFQSSQLSMIDIKQNPSERNSTFTDFNKNYNKNNNTQMQGNNLLQVQENKQDLDDSFVSCNSGNIAYNLSEKEQILELAKNFQLNSRSDDYRDPNMGTYGGFPLNDKAILQKFRTAFTQLLKKIGYELIRGRFQLHRVSFPIKYMYHKSIIEIVASVAQIAPVYHLAAAQAQTPLERMKFCMIASLAYIYPTHIFDKPLNPILGETYQAELDDGTCVYMEQVCHHPPISYTLLEGPQQCYKFYGYSSFQPKAHFNSIGLNVEGWKVFEFLDGTKIKCNNLQDTFQNTLSGTLTHLIHGKVEFIDSKNGLRGVYDIGNVKKMPKDYFTGAIYDQDDQQLTSLYGNYMGYIDFDQKRYWDARDQKLFEVKGLPLDKALPSDCRNRPDSQALLADAVDDAQVQKDAMEEVQRADRKLREAAEKRRKKGGPLISYEPYENKTKK